MFSFSLIDTDTHTNKTQTTPQINCLHLWTNQLMDADKISVPIITLFHWRKKKIKQGQDVNL